MTEQQIVDEILRYIKDELYNYAELIDGEWGSGKSYFANNKLRNAIIEQEKKRNNPRAVKYISLYGCRTIGDVQEKVAWSFAEDAQAKIKDKFHWKKKATTVSDNIVNTSRRIGNIVLKKFLPDNSVYAIAIDWLNLGAFIFIIDDLERCECSINQVFGFFNELVEHENTKVILIANEKEISGIAGPDNLELQYQLALNERIDWPKPETRYYQGYSTGKGQNNTVSIGELDRRREFLFPDKDANVEYLKIREKLLGVTLRYEPDIKSIIKTMILGLNCSECFKELLMDRQDYFYDTMNNYHHCNLRTFQFFLSKTMFLFEEADKITVINGDYKRDINQKIIENTFICSVLFKSNYKPEKTSIDWLIDKRDAKSTVIKDYVENGHFELESFTNEIIAIQEELSATVQADDPYNLIYNEYYYKTQYECENALESLISKLEDNKYPISMYSKIIIAIQRLVEIGFDAGYMERTIKVMKKNINTMGEIPEIDSDLWFMEASASTNTITKYIDELNDCIRTHTNKTRRQTIQEILVSNDWVGRLKIYIKPEGTQYVGDINIFSKAPVSEWVRVIHDASPEEINSFRIILRDIYPRNVHRKSYDVDKDSILQIRNELDKLQEDDLIKNASIGWLKNQFDEIISLHKAITYEN